MKTSIKNKLICFFSIILFCTLWQIVALTIDSPLVLPTLHSVLIRLIELLQTSQFYYALLGSFCRVLISFAISLALGTILGFLTGLFSEVKTFFAFPLAVIRSTPVVALVMIMLFWFSSEYIPIFCAILMALPVVNDAVSRAVESVDVKLLEMAKVFDFSRFTILKEIYFNSAKPYIAQSASTIFSLSWKVVAAGEILSLSKNALGTLIQDNRLILETSTVFALVILLVFACVLSKAVFIFIIKGVTPLGSALTRLANARSCATPKTDYVTSPAPNASISIQDLTFSYNQKQIFKNFNLIVSPSSITTILSPTGTGKTTLLNLIAGLIPQKQYTGQITCPKTSYIFQEHRFVPQISILKNIALPLVSKIGKKAAINQAQEYLKLVGLLNRSNDKIESLSGGEKQKASIARAFAFNASVLLMDEATNSLDPIAKEEIWTLIKTLQTTTPRTILNVTHDHQEAQEHSDCVVELAVKV